MREEYRMTIQLLHDLTERYKRFRTFSVNRMASSADMEKDSLSYWRLRVLFGIIFTAILVSMFIFVPVIALVIKTRMWFLLVFDGAVWATGIGFLFSRYPRYEIRAALVLLLFYATGLVITVSVGPLSGGPAWLFSFAVLTAILLGSQAAIVALAINTATLVTVGCLISAGMFGRTFPFFTSTEVMLSAGSNFILLNALAAISVSLLLKRIVSAHQKEKELAGTLERDRIRLIHAKKVLEMEVDERKRVEATLRENEEKFRYFVESINDVIYSVDPSGIITYISPVVETLLGYKVSNLIGRNITEFIYPRTFLMCWKSSKACSTEDSNRPSIDSSPNPADTSGYALRADRSSRRDGFTG